jgi:hypothetical protein
MTNLTSLKGVIDSFPQTTTGFSNMGDALRHGYYLLKDSSSDAAKYIIVLAANAPNKWTIDELNAPSTKTSTGNAVSIAGDGTIDADGKARAYAIEISGMIKSGGINTIFIDNSPNDISANINSIAEEAGASEVSTDKYYYTTTSLPDFSSIYRTTFQQPPDIAVLHNAIYTEILPEGIEVIDGPTGYVIDEVPFDGGTRKRLTIPLDIRLTYDGTKYNVQEYTINLKVRVKKLGDITFNGTDSTITYNIEYIDVNGDSKTAYFVKNFEDLTLNVFMSVDIG